MWSACHGGGSHRQVNTTTPQEWELGVGEPGEGVGVNRSIQQQTNTHVTGCGVGVMGKPRGQAQSQSGVGEGLSRVVGRGQAAHANASEGPPATGGTPSHRGTGVGLWAGRVTNKGWVRLGTTGRKPTSNNWALPTTRHHVIVLNGLG